MRLNFLPVLLIILFSSFSIFAQQTEEAVVPMTATIAVDTPSITLGWELGATAADLLILRREKDSLTWFVFMDSIGAVSTSLVDPFVEVGKKYEYVIQRVVNGIVAFGYMMVTVEAPVVDSRGKVLIFVEEALENSLNAELNRLEVDMEGDGFHVVWHSVTPDMGVQDVKNLIVTDYNADPDGVKMVFLLGEIPVPYSGNDNWDGHNDHQGAWVADTYYGDIDGVWTDNIINNTSPARDANDNIPGDGKFDNRIIPTASELPVGRVDFSNLMEGTFGATHTELIKRYLDKNHKWRTKQYTAESKALVDDNFGYFNGEAFAANGYRNFYPIVGKDNVVDGDWFSDSDTENWLFAYGCGGGSYVSAGGIGTSNQFANDSINFVFTMLFGSYFGDWDSEDNPFMPSALASKGGILSCSWAGRPHWFYHPMGAGETLGYCTKETQNAIDNPGYFNEALGGVLVTTSAPHVTLLGDPTLRAHIVAPVSDLVITNNCNTIDISWTASTQANVMGYHVYRSTDFNGGYTRLTTDPIMETNFTDATPPNDFILYNVKAVVLEETPSGSYYNTSSGVIDITLFEGGTPPSISADSETITCSNTEATVTPSSDAEIPIYEWAGPNGFTSNQEVISVMEPGAYQVTVTDIITGCTATLEIDVPVDMELPIANAGTDSEIDCANPEITLDGSQSTSGNNITYNWSTSDGMIVSGGNTPTPTVGAVGTYQIVVINNDNGCSATDEVIVSEDSALPFAEAGSSTQIDCDNSIVSLDGSGSSTGANISYFWSTNSGNIVAGGNTLTPEVNECAIYILEVLNNENGCTSTDHVEVFCDLEQPNISISGEFVIECNSFAMLTATSTAQNSSFEWSGPGISDPSNPSQTVNAPGLYTVLVTNNDNGCTNSNAVSVTQDTDLPQASPTVSNNIDCNNSTTIITSNPDMDGYLFGWAGPNNYTSSEENPTVDEAGTYSLVITNLINGCTSSYFVEVINDSTAPIADAGDDGELNCTTSIISLNGTGSSSGPNITYSWTTPDGNILSGQMTSSINLDQCGTYTLTVTNADNGCTSSDEAVVSCDLETPTADAGQDMVLDCAVVELMLNGQNSSTGSEFNYVWGGPGILSGANTLTPIINQAGTYFLNVINSENGCESLDEVEVTSDTNLPDLTIAGDTQIPCEGMSVSLTAVSNTPNVVITWSGPGIINPTSPVQDISEPGTFLVTATAPNNCVTTEEIEIGILPEIQINSLASIDCDGFHHLSVSASGGTPPYSIIINPPSPIPPNTTYEIVVQDDKGCMAELTDTTPDIEPLEVDITHVDESVSGANDGMASANPINGVGPFIYEWSNGESTETINNLSPGVYTVTITDVNGCQATQSVEIMPGVGSTGNIPGLTLFNVFPNPTTDVFILNLEIDNPNSFLIEILDVNGKRLQIASTDKISRLNQQFDLSIYPAGIYWCKISVEGHWISQRIVKQ